MNVRHAVGDAPEVLSQITDDDLSCAVWERRVPQEVELFARACAEHGALHGEATVEPASIGELSKLLAGATDCAACGWLRGDIEQLCAWLFAWSRGRRVRATLVCVRDGSCAKFHTDFIPLRLLCTYSGPGTEWLPEEAVDRSVVLDPPEDPEVANARIVRSPALIRRARAGDVLVMKGEAWPRNRGLGVVHRSAPIEGADQRRLVLTLTAMA